jgi:hypothetical protein
VILKTRPSQYYALAVPYPYLPANADPVYVISNRLTPIAPTVLRPLASSVLYPNETSERCITPIVPPTQNPLARRSPAFASTSPVLPSKLAPKEIFPEATNDKACPALDCPTSDSAVTKHLSLQDIVDSRLAKYLRGPLTTKIKDTFIREHLPTRVQIALEQPFGKDTLTQSFYSEVTFRHTIPYLYNLGWLPKKDRSNLERACSLAKQYAILWKRYRHTDFRSARGFWKNWQNKDQLDFARKDMITACFLHYFCDTPTVMRYLGGPYVSAHRDTEAILATLQPVLDPPVFIELARAY